MNLIFLSYLPAIIGLNLLALVTYLNNPKARINRLFVLFVLLVGVWQISLLFADTASTDTGALWSLRTANFFGSALGLSFLVLCDSFPASSLRQLRRKVILVLGAITLIFMALSFTDLMTMDVMRTDSGAVPKTASIVYSLQTLFIVAEVIMGVVLIARRRKLVSVQQRSQIRLFSFGIIAATAIVLIPGFVFILLDVTSISTVFLTSISFFIFSLFVWVSITRHDLFSVRSVVARAVAYVISAFIIFSLYAVIVGVLIDKYVSVQTLRFALTGASALAVIFSFTWIKKFFDKVTNRLFYREAYSSRAKLDELTDGLVSHIELKKLADSSIAVIKSAVRPEKIAIVTLTGKQLVFFGSKFKVTHEELKDIVSATSEQHVSGVLIASRVGELEEKQLRMAHIQALVPVMSANQLEGYIVLGDRSSGEVYSYQDIEFLKIAARNVGLAINNAKSFQRIKDFNKTLEAEVKQATHELREKNTELEDLHKTKDDFISMASHQLRPKITASRGFLDLLERTDLKTTKEQSELLDLTQQGIARMSDIVVDMLDISRMDNAMQLKFSDKDVDIALLVSEEIASLVGGKKTHRYRLKAKSDKSGAFAKMDIIKIREVIANLLSNADQYSPGDSMIEVRVTTEKDDIKVAVTDKGIGMTPDEQKRLFGKFYRSDEAKSIRPAGSGIGLYMSKKVVEAHGGVVTVTSTKGKGSTIGFALPRTPKNVG